LKPKPARWCGRADEAQWPAAAGQGLRCYTVDLRETEIKALMRRGLLFAGEQADARAVPSGAVSVPCRQPRAPVVTRNTKAGDGQGTRPPGRARKARTTAVRGLDNQGRPAAETHRRITTFPPIDTYDAELATAICTDIAAGATVARAAKNHGIAESTFWLWRAKHPELSDSYERARVERTAVWGEEIIKIADDVSDDPRSRDVRIKARQWHMARVDHRQWGDRKDINTNMAAVVAAMSPAEKDRRVAALLERLKLIAAPLLDAQVTDAEVVEEPSGIGREPG
jgi:transposase-like protein